MGRQRALVLTGDLGMGHHVITEIVVGSLDRLGWSTEVLDCMSLLGRLPSKVGDWVFRRLTATPTLYDGVHFSHFRPGSRLASAVDWGATSRLVPVLDRHLEDHPVDLLVFHLCNGIIGHREADRGQTNVRAARDGRAVHGRLATSPVGVGGSRPVHGDLPRGRCCGAPLRAAGTDRRRAAPGPARLLRSAVPARRVASHSGSTRPLGAFS